MQVWTMIFIFNWVMFKLHVNFQGCMQHEQIFFMESPDVSVCHRIRCPKKSNGFVATNNGSHFEGLINILCIYVFLIISFDLGQSMKIHYILYARLWLSHVTWDNEDFQMPFGAFLPVEQMWIKKADGFYSGGLEDRMWLLTTNCCLFP